MVRVQAHVGRARGGEDRAYAREPYRGKNEIINPIKTHFEVIERQRQRPFGLVPFAVRDSATVLGQKMMMTTIKHCIRALYVTVQ